MTLREANEAAAKCLPIEHGGIVYVRISAIGYKYQRDGIRTPFVRLVDQCGHCTVDASPEKCKSAERFENEKDK